VKQAVKQAVKQNDANNSPATVFADHGNQHIVVVVPASWAIAALGLCRLSRESPYPTGRTVTLEGFRRAHSFSA
jgi:hypothetical protein